MTLFMLKSSNYFLFLFFFLSFLCCMMIDTPTLIAKIPNIKRTACIVSELVSRRKPHRINIKHTDNAILDMYGLLDKEETEGEKLLAIKCPRCHQNNSPGAKFCFSCGMALDIKAAMAADEQDKQSGAALIEALKNPEFSEKITHILEEIVKKSQV